MSSSKKLKKNVDVHDFFQTGKLNSISDFKSLGHRKIITG